MNQLIASFPEQLKEAMEIGKKANIKQHDKEIRNVVVSGLGGSGIGGSLVAAICADQLKVPFIVNKGYTCPEFIDEHSLVIISSYSGNTEETLNVLKEVLKKNAKMVCVSSGGKVIEQAHTHQKDFIQIPGGKPPRACLGYSFVQQLYILKALNLINGDFEQQLLDGIHLLEQEKSFIHTEAGNLANHLNGKIPVLYIEDRMEAIAIRWRQQINENSKMLSWHHVVPEMNHNELVGWRNENQDLAVIFLRNSDDFNRNKQRMDLNMKLMHQYTSSVFEVFSKGSSFIEKALFLINVGDWLSVYLASNSEMDAVEVKVIDKLKSSLAEMEW
ncbi:MAG: bifunctional phosphoglucose/phosphomannose isomerase [Chitinophagales bacterium]|nr:bifunctional phosphoglucose/phosphomannose isomerase [Chitinophagales bacterium]